MTRRPSTGSMRWIYPGSEAPHSCRLPTLRNGGTSLTFRLPDADVVSKQLRARKVITDYRDDRLRFGCGIYHD